MASPFKYYLTALFFIFFSFQSFGQEKALQELANEKLFQMPSIGTRKERPLMKTKQQKINPIHKLSAGLLYFYQNVVSEQMQTSCSFETSCSEFTKKSLEKYGWIKGVCIGLNQYTNCVPNNHHYHCEHALNQDLKIINTRKNE